MLPPIYLFIIEFALLVPHHMSSVVNHQWVFARTEVLSYLLGLSNY